MKILVPNTIHTKNKALSRLRRLRELEILPGDYGVPAGEAWGDEAIGALVPFCLSCCSA
jgi:hypothetical protein